MSYLLTCLLILLKQPMMLLAAAVFFFGLAAWFVLYRRRASISVQTIPLLICLLLSLAILWFSMPKIAASVDAQLPPAPPTETDTADWLGRLFFGILAPCGLVYNLLFPQIQLKLWERDNLTAPHIQIRPYWHFGTICFSLVLLVACAVSLWNDSTLCPIFFLVAAFYAYSSVLIYTTTLHYTKDTLFYCVGRKQQQIPLSHITQACWERRSRMIAPVLVIYRTDGASIELPLCRYVGLRALFRSIDTCAAPLQEEEVEVIF